MEVQKVDKIKILLLIVCEMVSQSNVQMSF